MSDVWNICKAGILGIPSEIAATIDHDTDTVRMALIDNEGGSPYTFDPNHDFVADVFDGGTTGLEFSGTGYSRQTPTTIVVSTDDTDDEGVYDHDDVVFAGLDGATIAAALEHKQVGTDDTTPGDDPLLWYLTSADFPLTTNGGDVTIQIASEGVGNIT